MSDLTNDTNIILASASPRRRQLLESAGIKFLVIPSRVDEDGVCAETPEAYVKVLSRAKAGEVSRQFPDSWVIGADSVVAVDDSILNKPAGRSDARRMITMLSGRTHRVLTGYSIANLNNGHFFTDVEITRVSFKELGPGEIDWYLDTPEPYDKAGAYAIQGIGAFMVRRIEGSYTNVVGLPLSQIVDHLIAHRVIDRNGAGKKKAGIQ